MVRGHARHLDHVPAVFSSRALCGIRLRAFLDPLAWPAKAAHRARRPASGGLLRLPIIPSAAWKPAGTEEPIFRILALLAVTVGLPYFILSATGPLLQSWYSQIHPGRSPYRLYALSNARSLLALITFPVAFEPIFPSRHLASLWSWSFAAFAVLCGLCAWMAASNTGASITGALIAETKRGSRKKTQVASVSSGTGLLWFALAMIPSILLLATTNRLCLDVASVPFLWVLPLTLYLLSFILCFDSERW